MGGKRPARLVIDLGLPLPYNPRFPKAGFRVEVVP
jgi:hypothetical protein